MNRKTWQLFQSCPPLCDPLDCRLLGSFIHIIPPGKNNTGIDGYSLLQGILPKWKWKSVFSNSLWPTGLYSPWNSPGKNTGVGSLSLLQGIFPTQGSNPSLPQCRHILHQLSHKGSLRILEWVAYPFSSGFSQPRN